MDQKESKFLEWEDYGYANGWTQTPERVRLANNDEDAVFDYKTIGRCLTLVTCVKYKFTFKIDSSD